MQSVLFHCDFDSRETFLIQKIWLAANPVAYTIKDLWSYIYDRKLQLSLERNFQT
jgi:hypothetical protein